MYLIRIEGQGHDVPVPHDAVVARAGERVLAHTYKDFLWYPGTIEAVDADRRLIRFDLDDTTAWVKDHQVMPPDMDAQSRVHCQWWGDHTFYPATIADRKGDDIVIYYDDGDPDWVTPAVLRTWRGDFRTWLADVQRKKLLHKPDAPAS